MTVGSLETARMLADYFKDEPDHRYKRSPNGWRRIGVGAFRAAYLERDTDTVYKIGDYDANVSEAANSRRFRSRSTRSLGFDLVIPETRTYAVPARGNMIPERITAQRYAGKSRFTYCAAQDNWMRTTPPCNCSHRSPICYKIVHDRIEEWCGMPDIHGANILVDDLNRFWFIDMAD